MITQLTKEKYKIVVDNGFDLNGKRKRIFETFYGSKKEAKLRELEIKKSVKYGDYVKTCSMTFEELTDRYFEDYVIPNLSVKTISSYKQLSKRINGILGQYLIKNINPLTLSDLYKKLRLSDDGRLITNNTLLHYYNFINGVLKFGVSMQLITSNPNERIRRPKIVKNEIEIYTPDEVKKLLKCLEKENIKYQAIIVLALDSGCRRSELLGATWDDINLETKTFHINKSTVWVDGKIINKETKNPSSNRTIILTDYTVEIMKKYKEGQVTKKQLLRDRWGNSNKIFTTEDGNQMFPDTPSKILNKIIVKYNLKKISFHKLRHISASLQIYLGIHSKVISERLGHSNISTTMNIYSHIFKTVRQETADKLNHLFME